MKAVLAVVRRLTLGRILSAIAGLACMGMLPPAGAADAGPAAQPAGLFTVYNYLIGERFITWTTCGHNGTANGCWGQGQISGFAHPCAISAIGDTVVVVDSGNPGTSSPAALVVYRQVQSATTPSVNLVRRIVLDDLAPMSTAKCWSAAIRNEVYIGTDQSVFYFVVNLATGRVRSGEICGNPTDTVSSNGEYVVVQQGNCAGYFTRNGLQIVNGTYGTTFFPNPYASVPLQ